jgi:hypothetical protein
VFRVIGRRGGEVSVALSGDGETVGFMKGQTPKNPIWFAAVALIVLALITILGGLTQGVRHATNSNLLIALVLLLVGGVTAVGGLVALIWTFASFASLSSRRRWVGILVGLFALFVPLLSFQVFRGISMIAARFDFEVAGPERLRLAVEQLVLSAAQKSYELRWFGGEIPPDELPIIIRDFIPNAIYVTVDEHGVVIVTDGLAATRSGYMIIPANSDFVPERSRRIADGFYYVFTNGDE